MIPTVPSTSIGSANLAPREKLIAPLAQFCAPRISGDGRRFMLGLGGVILQFIRTRDYRYYRYTISARIFIFVAMTALYFKSRDSLFLVLDAIVLVGLLPSIYAGAVPDRSIRECRLPVPEAIGRELDNSIYSLAEHPLARS